jgi:hypothetical protein
MIGKTVSHYRVGEKLGLHSAHLEVLICEFRGPHLGSW